MSKWRSYQDFRLEDLTGGINTRDYPSEIEDKQMLSLSNWNFKWNKLVSEKGTEDTWLPSAPSPIWALKIDNNDLWTLADNVIYKNWIEQESKSGARLRVNWLTRAYDEAITDPNGDIISYTESSSEYFPDGVKYYVNIDGVDYWATGWSKNEIYLDLKEQLETAWYAVSIASEYIYITSSSPIVITTPAYITYVIYLKNIIESSNYIWSDWWVKWFMFDIDGYKWIYYDDDSLSGHWDKPIQYDKDIRDALYNAIDALAIPNIEIAKTFLSPWFLEDGTGTIYWKENEAWYASIILQKASSVNFTRWADTQDGVTSTWFNDLIAINSSNVFTTSNTIILREWETNELTIDPSVFSWTSEFITYLQANGYPNTIFIAWRYTGVWTSPSPSSGIYPLTADYESAYPISASWLPSDEIRITRWYGLQEDAFNIDTNTFENIPVNSTLPSMGRANIVVWNMGELIINKDDGWAFYFTDDVLYEIWDDAVGLPTVGTIYNGKIVLGWYEDDDNIVFSQTSSPSQPLNLLNFTDYSAWGQSISGWDKGVITGMKVGENWLYVFKDNSVWYSNSEKDTGTSFNLIFNKITSNGALSQNVITNVEQEIFYLDWKTRSVRRLGYEQNLTTLRDVAISREIAELFETLPEEQPMATASFSYPNYTLSLTDGTSNDVVYQNGKTYKANNKHFIYNVENKSWTTRTGIDDMLISDDDYHSSLDGKIYYSFKGNTLIPWEGTSKEYTFVDDVDWKRIWEMEVVGRIVADAWQDKEFAIQMLVDWQAVEIGEPDDLLKRKIVAENGSTVRFREKIELFDDGQTFQFVPLHNGQWYVEISDVSFRIKPLKITWQYY